MNTFTNSRPPAIDVLEPGYGPLFDRVVAVFAADERVRAMWLGGSLARGTADIASDLDVLVAVRERDVDAFLEEWRAWLADVTPTVIARRLPFLRGGFYSVTPGRERLDVVVESVDALTETPFRTRLLVFDRDGLDAEVPTPVAAVGPSSERVDTLVEEFFRDYGMFNTVVEREDWLLGVEAVHTIRSLLYQLFVEANAPLPGMGVKQWSTKLTPEQRAVLESLPTGVATRDGVVAAHEEVACAFVAHARPICRDLGVPWPEELDVATRRYLEGHGLPALEACPQP